MAKIPISAVINQWLNSVSKWQIRIHLNSWRFLFVHYSNYSKNPPGHLAHQPAPSLPSCVTSREPLFSSNVFHLCLVCFPPLMSMNLDECLNFCRRVFFSFLFTPDPVLIWVLCPVSINQFSHVSRWCWSAAFWFITSTHHQYSPSEFYSVLLRTQTVIRVPCAAVSLGGCCHCLQAGFPCGNGVIKYAITVRR